MPRRSAGSVRRERKPPAADAGAPSGWEERRQLPEGTFLVRNIAGAAALKTYRCPGCQQEIRAGVAHVVVWPADGDVNDRRHWHSSCWNRRATRGGPDRLPWAGM